MGELDADAARARLGFSDENLLRECEVHAYRASGPGGQKRNKTSSAVRLHHGPTGLIALAEESRSQHENKARALRRLREAIAIGYRQPLPEAIDWPAEIVSGAGGLAVGRKHPRRLEVLAVALDALAEYEGRISEAAGRLGVSASSLTRFLAEHPKAWALANRLRADFGHGPLKSPR